MADPWPPENLGAWAEVLAFVLATGQHRNPWNSYFGPMGSGTDAEGKICYFPDIAGTPPDVVTHWAARARSLKHPFLKARYADLAWEMSGPIGNRKAVDRLLEDKKAGVTEAERAELVADLEGIVTKCSNTQDSAHLNPHEAKDAAERLIPYYRRLGKFDDIKRLHKAVGESFEHFASNAEPMLAAALLQAATDEYRNAGLKEGCDRTRILM